MIRIGAVTIDVSHPRAFATKINENLADRAAYTAVFNDCFRLDEEVEAFAKDFNLTIYKDLDEMIDNIDIGFVHCCNWDKHLDYAMAFINKGKPVFIDKPIVGNTADLAKYQALVKAGARILGTSALRYAFEVQDMKKEFAEKGIKALHSIVTVGLDDFNYAIHAVEEICGIHYPAHPVSTRHFATTAAEGQTIEHYFVKFDDNSTAEYICGSPRFGKFNTIVISSGTPADDKCLAIDTSRVYLAMLQQVELELKGEPNILASSDRTEEAIRIMLAGKASLENGDIEVKLNSGLLDNTYFDGYAFETGYARAAGYADYTAERK